MSHKITGNFRQMRQLLSYSLAPERKLSNIIVSQDDYGDTNTLNGALKLITKNGGSIFIKAGTYSYDGHITIPYDNIEIYGEGNATKLQFNGFIISAKSRVYIHDLKVGNYTEIPNTIFDMDDCDKCKIENIYSDSLDTSTFIDMDDCTYCEIIKNAVHSSDLCIYLNTDCKGNVISGNSMDSILTNGIVLNSNCDENTITNNVCLGQATGSAGSIGIKINGATNQNNTLTGNVVFYFETQISNTGT